MNLLCYVSRVVILALLGVGLLVLPEADAVRVVQEQVGQPVFERPATSSSAGSASAVQAELSRIDAAISERSSVLDPTQLIGQTPIRPRRIYQNYVKQVALPTRQLLALRDRLNVQPTALNLQHLSAKSHGIHQQLKRIEGQFESDEATFETYRLLRTASEELMALVDDWQLQVRMRPVYRYGEVAAVEDETVTKTRVLRVMGLLDQLAHQQKTMEALNAALP